MQNNQIVLFGYHHKNAPVELRDLVVLSHDQILVFIEEGLNANIGIREMAVISTCNRTEFYTVTTEPTKLKDWIFAQYEKRLGIRPTDGWPDPVLLFNEQTISHLLGVAGGLESMMLGENQILSQVKASHNLILSTGYKFPLLNRLFQEAIRAGKAIRTNTELSVGAVSISLAAVELASKIYSNSEKHPILLVGAGETNKLVATHFQEKGASNFIIANRGVENRERLAAQFGGRSVSLDELDQALTEVDIVVTATGAKHHLIEKQQLKAILKRRRRGALLLVDISSPRNIDPQVGDLPDVFLYHMDHLQDVVRDNLDRRRAQIPAAEQIIEKIKDEYQDWLKTLEVVPTISQLSKYFHMVRDQELGKYVNRSDEKEYARLQELSNGIVKKLLHYPIVNLREMANDEQLDQSKINAIWEIFNMKKLDD
ncbi:MAG: glutamyl-tRNA reductase [Candidatus Marinimicrobia bacterium]|nr:glutamyl-tRNA reductase [Candidatus Neomarinimicrobiota bacterium]